MNSKALQSLKACLCLLLVFGLCQPAFAIEIATGKMLGKGYDARAFYVREGRGLWRKSYSGPRFRP